ncbi:MAG: DUF2235 domain-containing protein [Gammaproteobacteria bacterium]|nr:DUF2235 domain-containing protein [Gammaproteobacteria bacterium]
MKNIAICCDGTGNEFGQNNTNVVETYLALDKDDDQIAYYDPGVGTGGWEYQEERGELRAMGDKATGYGLQKNVEDACRFLADNFEEGDRVYLFGFSRGAFTVRSLAGMIFKCGLLRPGHDNLVEYASRIYNTEDNAAVAAGFLEAFGRSCPIHFIGVWDTVESLVMHAGKRFHDATLNPDVSFGYHALAIDERREDFLPSPWDESRAVEGQTIEQVWFAGVHSDVGGWYDDRGLSNISLHWMLGKAAGCGLRLTMPTEERLKPNPHGEGHHSDTGFWRIRGRSARKIPDSARIHRSVIARMDNPANRYQPNNLPEEPTLVD